MGQERVPVPLLEAGLVIAWSSGFVGAQLASNSAPIFLVMLWRFILVALVLLPFVILYALRSSSRESYRRALKQNSVMGALAMFGFLALAAKSVDLGVPAGLVALVAALQPLTTAAFSGPLLGEAVRPRQWLGLFIGFLGVAVAVSATLGSAPLWAYVLPIGAMASLVAGTLYAKARSDDTPLPASIGIQSLVAAILFLPIAALEGGIEPIATEGFIAAVLWFILLSTIGAYGFYWWCLRRTSAVRVGSLIYLTPPVTMFWAWLMFGDPLHPGGIAGLVICLIGVYLSRETPVTKPARLKQT